MIFSCPSCGASHFKPDAEVENGADVVCRRCRHEFAVNLDGVVEDASAPAAASEEANRDAPQDAAGFESSATAIMDTGGMTGFDDGPTEVGDAGATRTDVPAIEPPPSHAGAEATNTDVAPVESVGDLVGETRPIEAQSTEPPALDDFLAGETQAFETAPPGGADLADAHAADLESFPGAPDPRFATPEPFEASEASEPHDPLEPQAPNDIDPALLAARDEARGGTVADADLPDDVQPLSAGDDFDEGPAPRPTEQPDSQTATTGARLRAQRVLAAGRRGFSELGTAFARQPPGVKVAVAVLVVTLLVLSALVASSLGPPGPQERWVKFRVALRSGPSHGEGYQDLDHLQPGAAVSAYESTLTFTLVRDALGRVGYVANESLGDTPPMLEASQPFADCVQAPIESGSEACKGRARTQLDRCEASCNGDDQGCIDGCANQFTQCLAGCEERLQVAEPAAAVAEVDSEDVKAEPEDVDVEPAPEDPPAQPSDEPASAAEEPEPASSEDAGTVEEAEENNQRKRRRPRKKRRRRKRR